MTCSLDHHPHFASWTDPESGVTSYPLKAVTAPYQRAWYFVEPSLGSSGHLWFYSAHPPCRKWHSSVVSLDPDKPELTPLPGTFDFLEGGNPMLNHTGDTAWVPIEDRIYEYRIGQLDEPRCVFQLPSSVTRNRRVFRLVTDLTKSPDGKHFLLDSWIGNQYHIGFANCESGEYQELASFGTNHHHAIYSKHDPNLFLINQGHYMDPIGGHKIQMQVRIWVMSAVLSHFDRSKLFVVRGVRGV